MDEIDFLLLSRGLSEISFNLFLKLRGAFPKLCFLSAAGLLT